MAKTFEQRLKELKAEFNEAKNEEIRLTTRLEEAKKRRKEAVQKIKDKGYEVKDLPKVIKEKEEELEKTFEEIEQYLPSEENEDEDFEY